MTDKFSQEHNIVHNKSKIRALYPSTKSKNKTLEPNCANLVIINNKIVYKLWHNCISYGHNIEHNR